MMPWISRLKPLYRARAKYEKFEKLFGVKIKL